MSNKIKDFTCNVVDVSISKGVKPFKLELDTKGPIKTMNIFLSGAGKFRTIPKWGGNDIPPLILHNAHVPIMGMFMNDCNNHRENHYRMLDNMLTQLRFA
jgi:hypothetical protein